MRIEEVDFFEMKLPTIRLKASVGLEGPFVIAWDREGYHVGAAPLGGSIRITRPRGPSAPWAIYGDEGKQITLAWCDEDTVRNVARTFGIVGDGMGVTRCFYESPAWVALRELVAADPARARQWRDQDAYCPGWFKGAMHEIRQSGQLQ